jgi:uncharacterized protein (TIGR02118 family)
MIRVLVLFGQPGDESEFLRHYTEKHVPLARLIPGLLAYTYSIELTSADGSGSPYILVAALDFADHESMTLGLASPEGTAASGDVAEFATGGVTVLTTTLNSVSLSGTA